MNRFYARASKFAHLAQAVPFFFLDILYCELSDRLIEFILLPSERIKVLAKDLRI